MAAKRLGTLRAENDMAALWKCPKCRRGFTRPNQRHRCGTGDRAQVLAGRPDWLVGSFEALETFVHTLGKVEVVTRDRYALFRTRRIFADAVIMKDALRLAIHLPQRVESPLFFKIAADGDRGQVTHVALLKEGASLAALEPHIRKAFEHSLRERQ